MKLNELGELDDLKLEELHELSHKRVEIFLDVYPGLLETDPISLLKKALGLKREIISIEDAFFFSIIAKNIEANPIIHLLPTNDVATIYNCIDLSYFIFKKNLKEVVRLVKLITPALN